MLFCTVFAGKEPLTGSTPNVARGEKGGKLAHILRIGSIGKQFDRHKRSIRNGAGHEIGGGKGQVAKGCLPLKVGWMRPTCHGGNPFVLDGVRSFCGCLLWLAL